MALKPCLLIYDIPEASDAPNPSPWLRRRAVRINLSCWVVPEANIPYMRLKELEKEGATVHIVPFADHGIEKILSLVRSAIQKEIAEATARAEESMQKAEKKLASEDDDAYADLRAFRKRADAARTRTAELINDLDQARRLFGIRAEKGDDLAESMARVRLLRDKYEQRAKRIAQMAVALMESGGDRKKMGELLAQDDAEPLIAADMAEEAGIDTSELREAYREE